MDRKTTFEFSLWLFERERQREMEGTKKEPRDFWKVDNPKHRIKSYYTQWNTRSRDREREKTQRKWTCVWPKHEAEKGLRLTKYYLTERNWKNHSCVRCFVGLFVGSDRERENWTKRILNIHRWNKSERGREKDMPFENAITTKDTISIRNLLTGKRRRRRRRRRR